MSIDDKENSIVSIDWVFGTKPSINGWYAILYCWEPEEGVFDDAARWNDGKWGDGSYYTYLPIFCYSSSSFATQLEAEDWAYDHNPENH